jgi:hypothetical protein
MVGTITPIVHGDQKKGSWILGLHIAAYIIGSVILGTMLGSFGILFVADRLSKGWGIPAVAATSLLCGTRELGLIALPLPQIKWQVPAKWRRFPPGVMMTFYGLVLGTGVANRVAVSTFHVAVLWAMLCRNPLLAASVLSGFGIGRAVSLLWMTCNSQAANECLVAVASIGRFLPFVRILSGLGLVFVGSCFLSGWLCG